MAKSMKSQIYQKNAKKHVKPHKNQISLLGQTLINVRENLLQSVPIMDKHNKEF